MFGFLRDVARGIGSVVGTVVGVPIALVAETLEITVDMVEEAKKAGCKTYEDIRKFHNL